MSYTSTDEPGEPLEARAGRLLLGPLRKALESKNCDRLGNVKSTTAAVARPSAPTYRADAPLQHGQTNRLPYTGKIPSVPRAAETVAQIRRTLFCHLIWLRRHVWDGRFMTVRSFYPLELQALG